MQFYTMILMVSVFSNTFIVLFQWCGMLTVAATGTGGD